MKNSNIQWTNHTWNVARGCTKVDEDCKFCYMYRDSMNGTRYEPKKVVRTKTVFNLPLRIEQPSKIFTSSLTDFFHEDIDSYRDEAWDIIRRCPQHTFQILTKRPERIADHLPKDWGAGWDNVWLGASVGSPGGYLRIASLVKVNAKVLFLSCEPLWGPLNLRHIDAEQLGDNDLCQIDALTGDHTDMGRPWFDVSKILWVIVGGESGNENGKYLYRECHLEWIESIVAQCQDAGVPVFVKQFGTHLAKKMGLKDRHGGDINEWPAHLRVRQFPRIFNKYFQPTV